MSPTSPSHGTVVCWNQGLKLTWSPIATIHLTSVWDAVSRHRGALAYTRAPASTKAASLSSRLDSASVVLTSWGSCRTGIGRRSEPAVHDAATGRSGAPTVAAALQDRRCAPKHPYRHNPNSSKVADSQPVDFATSGHPLRCLSRYGELLAEKFRVEAAVELTVRNLRGARAGGEGQLGRRRTRG
jgi:hypothetical protein